MSSMGIAILATGLSLVLIFVWMISLSMRKQRLDIERKAREVTYRRAMQRAREQELEERQFKAETGHIPTILFMAKEAERSNLKQALYWYDKAAKMDNVTAMYAIVRLSEMMREDVILKEQANFWRIAIAGVEGDVDAKFTSGKALVFGRGVEKNPTKGHELIEAAAAEGCVEAMLYMGKWQLSPENASAKSSDALFWFMKAAERGSSAGKTQVGLCYLKGTGTTKSVVKGRYWLERAAESGNAKAMYHAGEAWRESGKTGNAVAYIWLFLSANKGYEPARILRDKVAANLSVDVLVGLQAIAKPLQKKLALGGVKKHSIIRVLNKIYKRKTYFPDEVEINEAPTDESVIEADLINQEYTADVQHDVVIGETDSRAQSASTPQQPSKDALDFTQGFH